MVEGLVSAVTMKKAIYKATYPKGKIYVGKDLTNTLTYFGSVNDNLVKKDFSEEQIKSFTITKEIIFESENIEEINKVEAKFIADLQSNNL